MKAIKSRRMLNGILSLILVAVMTFATSTSVFAASGVKKVTTSGKMSVTLNVGQTANSNVVSFNVSGLPSNAVITKLQVNTGTLTFQGGVISNYVTITGPGERTEQIPWGGAANTNLNTSNFLGSFANGTYTLSFNATCISGAIVGGTILDVGTKAYSNSYITVFWDDTL